MQRFCAQSARSAVLNSTISPRGVRSGTYLQSPFRPREWNSTCLEEKLFNSKLREQSYMSSSAAKTADPVRERGFPVSILPSRRCRTRDLIEVQEEERRRISQELHDDLGQRLALFEIQIHQLEHKCPSADIAKGLKSLRDRVGEMDRDIHRICYELYPVVLEKLGLIVALSSLCRECSEMTGISTLFDHENVPKYMPDNASLCLYRLVQEALHNVFKHAKAKGVKVSLRGIAGGIAVKVVDS